MRVVIKDEVAASRRLEAIAYGKMPAHVFRSEVLLESETGKIA